MKTAKKLLNISVQPVGMSKREVSLRKVFGFLFIFIFYCNSLLFAQADGGAPELILQKLHELDLTTTEINKRLSSDNKVNSELLKKLVEQLDLLNKSVVKNDPDIIKKAQQSYNKAMELSIKGDFQGAGLYFSHAISLTPDNLTIISGYTDAVLRWADQRQVQGDYQSALQGINEYIRYLQRIAEKTAPATADYIFNSFTLLNKRKADLNANAAKLKEHQDNLKKEEVEMQSKLLLNKQLPDNEKELIEHFRKLQSLTLQWQRVGVNDVVMESQLDRTISVVADNIEAYSLLANGTDILKRASKSYGSMAGNYSTNEAFITIQRLNALKPSLTPALQARVEQFSKEFDKLTGTLSADNTRATWERVEQKYISISNAIKLNKLKEPSIRQLSSFADDVNIELVRMNNPEYVEKLRSLLNEVNQQVATMRDEQVVLYEKWAIKNIKTLFDQYSIEIGLMGVSKESKKRISEGLKSYICPVDTRFLSVSGTKIYSDIYDYFYKELDRDQRIDLSVYFADCKKKSLADF